MATFDGREGDSTLTWKSKLFSSLNKPMLKIWFDLGVDNERLIFKD